MEHKNSSTIRKGEITFAIETNYTCVVCGVVIKEFLLTYDSILTKELLMDYEDQETIIGDIGI